MPSFKIGINMAGAVSAGAYTAGVLDFLTEALDEWYKAKASGEPVPMHDVSLEVLTGASAGGMCAAISAVLLQQDFQHIHTISELDAKGHVGLDGNQPVPLTGTTNLLYEGWVNRIDIRPLLSTDDLAQDQPVVSLLNSTIIEEIANYALNAPAKLATPRAWVSPNLRLYLSLTNLRGTPYSLNAAAVGSLEETTFFYGTRIGFQTVRDGSTSGLLPNGLHAVNLTIPGAAGGWDLLQTAAMATGAFPVFLKPRVLQRNFSEFTPPHWESVIPAPAAGTLPIQPNFPAGFAEPFVTLNVDGGITNNDPFKYAQDYLATTLPLFKGEDPGHPQHADRAVINIAPFPTVDPFDRRYDVEKHSGVLAALSKLFSVLVSQSRFYGESLNDIMSGTTFSRFVIAPSDQELIDKNPSGGWIHADQPPALQCASLGAFGGFLERKFRAHDYMLGRRNCQKFLDASFVLPFENPIIAAGLEPGSLEPGSMDVIWKKYRRDAPGTYAHTKKELHAKRQAIPEEQQKAGQDWLPIIPLVGTLSIPIVRTERALISQESLDEIVKLAKKRYRKVVGKLIDLIPNPVFQIFLAVGQPFIAWRVADLMKQALIRNLGDACEPEL